MWSFLVNLRYVYTGIKNFFEELEKELARHDREMELASKRPLSEPCPECGGQFSIIRFLPPASYFPDPLSPITPFPFLANPATITVCADCGRPI